MHFADLCGHEQRPDGVLDVTAELSAKRNEKRKMTKYQIYINTSLQSSQLSEEIDSRIPFNSRHTGRNRGSCRRHAAVRDTATR